LIRQVDWQVELDERWVVLGPNGAGKTTLLNLAAGRAHPTSGSLHVLGERIGRTDLQELRTRVGYSTAALSERIAEIGKLAGPNSGRDGTCAPSRRGSEISLERQGPGR
jgi:iron complex transport system ATP-binding protein